MARFLTWLKNIFFILLFLQIAPMLFISIKKHYSSLLEQRTKVGVILLDDELTKSQVYVEQLKKLFKDTEIRAILLRINCPGGTPGAAQAFYSELRQLKEEYSKTVGVFVENICTSGAYYAACPADFIVATPSAFVGSIGVYIPLPHLKEFINQYKIDYSVVKTGDYKTTGDMFLQQTSHGQEMLQALTDDTYDQFINDVMEARPLLTKALVNDWANGKVFTGRQALKNGLIDAVGSQSTVESLLRKKAPIDGEIEWVYNKKNHGIIRSLFSEDEDTPDSGSFTEGVINKISTLIVNKLTLPR